MVIIEIMNQLHLGLKQTFASITLKSADYVLCYLIDHFGQKKKVLRRQLHKAEGATSSGSRRSVI